MGITIILQEDAGLDPSFPKTLIAICMPFWVHEDCVSFIYFIN